MSKVECDAVEIVNLQHMAVAEEGRLRWMTGRKIGECELYAMPNFGPLREPLMTVAQHSRIVAAKDAEIARLEAGNKLLRGPEETVTSARGDKLFTFMSKDPCRYRLCEVTYAAPVRKLIAERDELRAQLAVMTNERDAWVGRADHSARSLDMVTPAARDVLAERKRQITAEGWTPEHDDEHGDGSMCMAAVCYAEWAHYGHPNDGEGLIPINWPWAPDWWKPGDHRRNLVKAGALILAEIERLDRAAPASDSGEGK